MSDQNDQSNSTPTSQRRRSSFVGQAFTDMFSRSSRPSESSGNSPPTQGPITTAAAEASRRRLSVSTLSMGASPNQNSPMSARVRGESVSSFSNVGSLDESAIDDEPSSATAGNSGPFARRVSFGARALKDMKGGPGSVPAEGFNWADNMRSRAERGSITGISASPPAGAGGWTHTRSKSIAVMDTPVRDNPKPVNVPDQFQERILKGDFYMD